jgi:hypothetical protein
MLWTRYFVEAQEYSVNVVSIMNQDNMSAILLEKNRRTASIQRNKNINIRCFFIKDRIASGEITAKHCSSTEMLADHFTKTLQRTLFRICVMHIWAETDLAQLISKKRTRAAPANRSVLAHINIVPT